MEGQSKYRSAVAAAQPHPSWPVKVRTPLIPTNQYLPYDDGAGYGPQEGYQQWL